MGNYAEICGDFDWKKKYISGALLLFLNFLI